MSTERVCALCLESFTGLDIVLEYRDLRTHYVFCPHERWKPPAWPLVATPERSEGAT